MQTNIQNNADRVPALVNAKKTKTWKIGEECAGGIIRVKSVGDTVLIEIRDYFTKKPIDRKVFGKIHTYRVDEYLSQFTTSYHSNEVAEWIRANVWGNK